MMHSMPTDLTILEQGMIFHIRKPSGEPHANVNILLHGWTGDENSMNSYWGYFPDEDWLISPRAPLSVSVGGYSWAQIEKNKYPPYHQFLPSAEQFLSNLNSLRKEYHLTSTKMNIIGFSQGSALAYVLATLIPNEIKSIFSIAGFLPQGTQQILEKKINLSTKIFILHGAKDKMVPIEMAIQDEASLRSIGYQTQLCVDENAGHKLGAACVQVLKTSL